MQNNLGSWVETASGKKLDFINPDPDTIDINDIAIALSNLCRFTGHVTFYSVAEHSVYVASRVPREYRLAALLHDAAEAYLGDINSPLKQHLPEFRKIEDNLLKVIMQKFGATTDWGVIKKADYDQLFNEASILLPSRGLDWGIKPDEDFKIRSEFLPRCLPPQVASQMFLSAFELLTEPEPFPFIEGVV